MLTPLSRATRIFPSAEAVVAKSMIIGSSSSAAGAAKVMGFVLIRPSAPPKGAVRIMPGPPAVMKNTTSRSAANSDHSPSRPMWLQFRMPPIATREDFDFSASARVNASAAK